MNEQSLFSDDDLLKASVDLIVGKLKYIDESIKLFKRDFNVNQFIVSFEDIINYKSDDPVRQNHFDFLVKEHSINSLNVFKNIFDYNKDNIYKLLSEINKITPTLYKNILSNMDFKEINPIIEKQLNKYNNVINNSNLKKDKNIEINH